MLQNLIVDADLKKYNPNIAQYLWLGSADYSVQIAEAFALVLDDLRARGLEIRRLGKSIDLRRLPTSTSSENAPTSSIDLLSTTGSHVVGRDGFTRLVAVVTSGTGSLVFQGSNDTQITPDVEPTGWTTIATLTAAAGTLNTRFADEYKYYRLNSVVTTTLTYTACLHETRHERSVIWKAFELIFRDFIKQSGDAWDMRATVAMQNYTSAISGLKLLIDSDDDNIPEQGDLTVSGQVRMSR